MSSLYAQYWIADKEDGKVFIYYASRRIPRMHVATSTIDRLVDYCMNTRRRFHHFGQSAEDHQAADGQGAGDGRP